MMAAGFLSRVPLFSDLESYELDRLLEGTAPIEIAAGEVLFRRGDRGDALYIVEAGLLDAVIDEGTPTERTLNTFFPGDYFGEMALLTREPRSATIRAVTDCRLLRLSYEQFAQLLQEKPSMALHLSKVLSNYLSRTNARLSRRAARISTIIPAGDAKLVEPLAPRLLASLQKQFGSDAVVVMLGDSGFLSDTVEQDVSDIGNLKVRPLPSGGHCLCFGAEALRDLDSLALVSIINSLRVQYGHILVWARPSDALQRLSFLTRFDQTFLLAAHPKEIVSWGEVDRDWRAAYVFPPGAAQVPGGVSGVPPLKLYTDAAGVVAQESVDSFARALAGFSVGLALGSGTAQGLAHLGVMKALIEAGIPIDLIAGTSGGALYGSLIASGLSIGEAVEAVVRQTRRNLVDKLDFALPVKGVIRGNLIERMIRACIGDIAFEQLPTPLYAIAADLDTGEEVVLREGPVYKGVRASISVPGIFTPYPLNGRILIDGVAVNPLPVSVARAMGADIVIAVQVPAPGKVNMEASARNTRKRGSGYNIISTVVRSHHFVGDRLADQSATDADVFIRPEVTGFGWREYSAAPSIIEAGYIAGQAAVERIKALLR